MDIAFIYVGLAQSLFSAFLMFFKKPKNISNKILGYWLLAIGSMFALNIIKIYYNINTDIWPVSLTLAVSFPIFLFLYTKYVVSDYQKFLILDYLHFIPVIVGFILVLYFVPSLIKGVDALLFQLKNIKSPNFNGYIFVSYIWVYSILSLILIANYRKKHHNFFSFKSYKISLNWLIFIIVSFLIVYNFIIFISTVHYGSRFISHIEIFRSGALLIFVYIISIWGFKQNQLATTIRTPKFNFFKKVEAPESDRYKKSGLTKKKAEDYAKALINHMNDSCSWKNNELTIATLSEETSIPKHHITQVLNENIKKNFYTFVNEYRAEQAMEMLKSQKFDSLSFIGIAFESGFNSKTAFNIFFKKYSGMTPSEFKRTMRKAS